MRLIQYTTRGGNRRVGRISEGTSDPVELAGHSSVRDLALAARRAGKGLAEFAGADPGAGAVDYDAIIAERRLLLPLDHPEPSRCVLAITGLTHLASALSRDAMHAEQGAAPVTDSMKLFKSGLQGGKPAKGNVGVQSEWAYKGDGRWAVPPGAAIVSPAFALDGGEEAEVVGLYVIDDNGEVLRVGFALGNEFSDHVMERQNYLYLAHSKLRPCSFGPEILVGELPSSVRGRVRILRSGNPVWSAEFLTGEDNMSHSIANLEHHHFKYPAFRQPGDIHVYFYGASSLSCADNVTLVEGDVMELRSDIFGRPLVNEFSLARDDASPKIVQA